MAGHLLGCNLQRYFILPNYILRTQCRKKMNHKILHISSKDKKTGDNHNFSLNLSNHYWTQNVKSIVIKQITIPHVFYNIHESNSSFTYNIASTPSTVTITQGDYTIANLLDALNTAMVADGVVGFTATQNTITKKIEFASTTAIEYLFTGNAMAETLGITAGNGSDVTTFNAQSLPKLQGVRNIAIVSSSLGQNNYLNTDQKIQDTIAIIPITETFGSIIHYLSPHTEIDDYDSLSQRNGTNISQIDIKVYDKDRNELLDLTNHHIDIILKCYY